MTGTIERYVAALELGVIVGADGRRWLVRGRDLLGFPANTTAGRLALPWVAAAGDAVEFCPAGAASVLVAKEVRPVGGRVSATPPAAGRGGAARPAEVRA